MSTFDERIEHYKKTKKDRESGVYSYIPFTDALPRLAKYVPGIIPGIAYQILANSGVGKSKLFRFLFLQVAYDFVKNHPDAGITFKVILNSLEESKAELIDSFVINRVYRKYGISLTINQLNGFDERILTDKEIVAIETEREYFADMSNYIEIVNSHNPFGFYKIIRAYAQNNGVFYTRTDEPIVVYDKEGNNLIAKDAEGWNSYVPNNPNEIVICATDHVWLYSAESKKSKYETVANFSSYYQRQIMNLKFGYTTVIVQQQESNKEKKEFTFKGQSIVEKLEPDLSSGGDIKILQRDQLVILGLFSPYRYKIPDYKGYDIKKLKDCARFLFVLKNRRGREGLIDPLFFNGAAETFEELPLPSNFGEPVSRELEEFYRKAGMLNS